MRKRLGMSSTLRFMIGAAAVVVAAVIGINLVAARHNSVGGQAAAGTPAPTPMSTPTSTPMATLIPVEGGIPLQPGTYLVPDPFPIPVTVTIPAGWSGDGGWPYAAFLAKHGEGNDVSLAFSLSQSLYLDPCNSSLGQQTGLGDAVGDLATALATLPHLQATTPTEVTIDGITGTRLTLTAPAQADGCPSSSGGYVVWKLPLGAVTSIQPGQRMTNWIAEVDGQRLVLSTWTSDADAAGDLAEMQAILASIHFVSQP